MIEARRQVLTNKTRNGSMSSNVHALELSKAFKRVDDGLPSEADVEEAFRTIIRWAGDDPERPGLLDTPARLVRSFREFF
ncbi:MAG: hypothetical protein WBF49_06335, partial [Methyloceanibacter sp.]